MDKLLLLCAVGVGITNILVNGEIFDGLRRFARNHVSFIGDMLDCMMCTGFWVGLLMAILDVYLYHGSASLSLIVLPPLCSFASDVYSSWRG